MLPAGICFAKTAFCGASLPGQREVRPAFVLQKQLFAERPRPIRRKLGRRLFCIFVFFQGAVHFEIDCNVSESIVTSSGERLDKNMCCPYYSIQKWIGGGLWGMWVRARIEAAGLSAGV